MVLQLSALLDLQWLWGHFTFLSLPQWLWALMAARRADLSFSSSTCCIFFTWPGPGVFIWQKEKHKQTCVFHPSIHPSLHVSMDLSHLLEAVPAPAGLDCFHQVAVQRRVFLHTSADHWSELLDWSKDWDWRSSRNHTAICLCGRSLCFSINH